MRGRQRVTAVQYIPVTLCDGILRLISILYGIGECGIYGKQIFIGFLVLDVECAAYLVVFTEALIPSIRIDIYTVRLERSTSGFLQGILLTVCICDICAGLHTFDPFGIVISASLCRGCQSFTFSKLVDFVRGRVINQGSTARFICVLPIGNDSDLVEFVETGSHCISVEKSLGCSGHLILSFFMN